MEKSSIARRRRVASLALLSLCAQVGTAVATTAPGPKCASGGGKGTLEVNVAALTSDGRLLCFKRRAAPAAREIGYVQGLMAADTRLVGIDYRVQDGFLYGVGNGGGVYRIDTDTAVAQFVNSLTVPLSGMSFGVDFNPAADRLRIISDNGQNLRHNVDAGGTLADTTLNYTTGVAATGLSGAAYTNNDLNANTATSLFDMDTSLDQIALQSPPNAGSLAATGKLVLADAGAQVGFDIYSLVKSGRTQSNSGFAVVTSGNVSRFYAVNVLTGRLTFMGRFGTEVIDIAVPLGQ